MSIKKSLEKLQNALGAKRSNNPIMVAGGTCNCCTTPTGECECWTYDQAGKVVSHAIYPGGCTGSGGGPQGSSTKCPCNRSAS